MDPVFFLPMEPKDDFALPEDKDMLEYGRVVLLFSVLLPGHLGKYREHDLAMVQYLDRYRVKGNKSVQLSVSVCCCARCTLNIR
jgi:hypothetical protein